MSIETFNSRKAFYKTPFGAVRVGEEIRYQIALPRGMAVESSSLLLSGWSGGQSEVPLTYLGEEQDSMLYGTSYRFEQTGVYWYAFRIRTSGGDWGVYRSPGGRGVLVQGEGAYYQQTVYQSSYYTPSRRKGGIIYQIFPDRFAKSDALSQRIESGIIPQDRMIRSDWGGQPFFLPDERGEVKNNDYFGGDFLGIRKKLPYLASLGVDCIYLNPIFEAHSNHRYNTADYRKADPLLGTNEEFRELCSAAHEYEIDIILDGVFSHTGSDSVYFNKYHRYDGLGAYNSTQSPYYSWYKFFDFPDGYQSWWGFDTLPEIEENDPDYTDFICGEGGVIDYWLSLGASGFRLDVADELPDTFLDRVSEAVKRRGQENLLVGEVWEDATNKESYGVKRRYLLGGQLDAVMNYPFKDAILDYIKYNNAYLFTERIMSIVENYPKPALDVMMNSLSTHDTERAITRLAGLSVEGKDRVWQSRTVLSVQEYTKGIKLLRLAMALQYFLPGIPSIYYGDEAGMQGYKDPFNRGCYPWGQENAELVDFARRLGEIRRQAGCLAEGELRFTGPDSQAEGGPLAFWRVGSDTALYVCLNNSPDPVANESAPLEKPHSILYGTEREGRLELGEYDFAVVLFYEGVQSEGS